MAQIKYQLVEQVHRKYEILKHRPFNRNDHLGRHGNGHRNNNLPNECERLYALRWFASGGPQTTNEHHNLERQQNAHYRGS